MNAVGTRFSVNVNKFALLRNARGRNVPDVVAIADRCLKAGLHGITVHPRVDQRHIRYDDVGALREVVRGYPGAELNVEGYPDERLMGVVLEAAPEQCTLVPDAPDQLTSDHGWAVASQERLLRAVIARLQAAGIRTSLFLDPDVEQVEAVARIGADCIELYTEEYASAFNTAQVEQVVEKYRLAAEAALGLGLKINAGHDLSLANLGYFLERVPGVHEVSIGHAFICEAIDYGLQETIRRYLDILQRVGS